MRMSSSVTSVSPVNGKLGLAQVSHTLSTGELVLRNRATWHRKAAGFLMSLLCVGPSVQNCHRHVKILDMSDERTDQSMRTTLFFADSSEVSSGIVFLGLVLSLFFFHKKGRTTDINTSSMDTGLIKCPSVST